MYEHRMATRLKLEKELDQDEWEYIIKQARLTNTQIEIINLRFGPENLYNWQIAERLNVNKSFVDKQLAKSYDKINKTLLKIDLDRF